MPFKPYAALVYTYVVLGVASDQADDPAGLGLSGRTRLTGVCKDAVMAASYFSYSLQ